MAKPVNNTTKKRISTVMMLMVFGGFSILVFQLYKLQIIQGEELQRKALNNQMRSTTISANRGSIYDRNMNTLAQSNTVWNVCLSPAEVTDDVELKLIADTLTPLLELEEDKITTLAKDVKSYYKHVKKGVNKDIADQITQFIKDNKLRSVFLEEDSVRAYKYGTMASTVLGFTGDQNKGAYGLEAYYDKELSGTPGMIVSAKNGWGTYMPYSYKQVHDAKDGNSLVLTIDEVIQHFAEKHLEAAVKEHNVGNRAVCIVMDVNTGEILAMATEPDFDPNNPREIHDPQIKANIEEIKENNPDKYLETLQQAQFDQWRNKAISDPYEPGSVFKIITAAAALDSLIVDPYTERFSCPGFHVVGPHSIGCWKTSGHGSITFADAVKYSCNPVFMKIGERLGAEDFYKYFDLFGLTEATGIDVPGEAVNTGLYHEIDALSKVPGAELATSAFGQTFKVTPIQLITALSASVNGGKLMEPYVVKQVVDAEGNIISATEPKVKRQVISEETSKLMRLLLEDVVKDQVGGSGRKIYMPGYRIGGKTGTSEKTDQRVNGKVVDHISSFAGFAPADDPQIMVLVLLDEPKMENVFGSVIASPVVGGILADTLPYLGIEPNYTEEEKLILDVAVPYLYGSKLSDAQSTVTQKGLKVRVVGTGTTITGQVPSSGSPIPIGGTVILYTDAEPEIRKVTVPNVVGLSGQQANKTILNAGLNIKLSGIPIELSGCVAESQSIAAGTEVNLGTVITVNFTDKNLAG